VSIRRDTIAQPLMGDTALSPQSSETVEAIVRFERVNKSYDGETLVVRDLNLDVARGEFLTLLGPSGSGKTTTLMMLAGFEVPTDGRIVLEDMEINSVPPHKRGLGMMFQNYALFPHMTVADNIAFPLTVRKMDKADVETRVRDVLEMVKLGGFGTRRPAQLSGGQQQRIALARALVFGPKLVLLDEPLGALDKQLREQMQYELKQIHEELGVTMIYVTHDQSEALTMSDRIAVMDGGVVQQLASPQELYQNPENAFVAQFIGENNRLVGTLESIEGNSCEVRLEDGGLIHALGVGALPQGGKVSLSLRPERVYINPLAGQFPNTFEARIDKLIYLGDHTRVVVSLCEQDDFVVKLSNDAGPPTLARGDIVRVGWRLEDCRAFALD
jgi:putative spermidine/putrescine transport system ATP-binding protein